MKSSFKNIIKILWIFWIVSNNSGGVIFLSSQIQFSKYSSKYDPYHHFTRAKSIIDLQSMSPSRTIIVLNPCSLRVPLRTQLSTWLTDQNPVDDFTPLSRTLTRLQVPRPPLLKTDPLAIRRSGLTTGENIEYIVQPLTSDLDLPLPSVSLHRPQYRTSL